MSVGIHKLFHCAPNVPHYAKNKAVGVMKPGHAFTIEPMISEGELRLLIASHEIVYRSFSQACGKTKRGRTTGPL